MTELSRNDKLRVFDWDQIDLHLRFCYEGSVPDTGHGRTQANFTSAWLVRGGWAEVSCGNHPAVRGHTGEWVFVPPGERLQRFSPQARIVSVAFDAAYLLKEHLFAENPPAVLSAGAVPQLDKMTARLLKVTTRGRLDFRYDTWEEKLDINGFLKLKMTFFSWLDAFADALRLREVHPHIRAAEDELVATALRLIHGLANQRELKVPELAQRLGISVSQLHRRFTRATGISLHRFYSQLRTEAACQRLHYSNSSLKEIAYEMGFQHPANFSNWFKAQTGVTPKAHRDR